MDTYIGTYACACTLMSVPYTHCPFKTHRYRCVRVCVQSTPFFRTHLCIYEHTYNNASLHARTYPPRTNVYANVQTTCTHTYKYLHIDTNVYTYMLTHIRTHTQIHTHSRTYSAHADTYIDKDIHTCMRVHTLVAHTHTHKYTNPYSLAYILSTHWHIHSYRHSYLHARTYTNTHTLACMHSSPKYQNTYTPERPPI